MNPSKPGGSTFHQYFPFSSAQFGMVSPTERAKVNYALTPSYSTHVRDARRLYKPPLNVTPYAYSLVCALVIRSRICKPWLGLN